jgi:class 3 adenylate cyclase/tetratricopeptide (TPR) repeat protein
MTFEDILDQALNMLQRRGRVTYGTLQRQFALDADALADLTEALLYTHPQIVDDQGRGLCWTGDAAATPAVSPAASPATPQVPEAERRQLTVLFCDLVDSTVLARQLDPEELRAVVRAYQDTCAKVIARFEGHIAQYLGDGLLVYFGYPLAHEDDAQRAVRAGLGMIDALGQLNPRLGQERGIQLAVRLGIHTGLVVVGDVGSGTRQEQLALGETPNLAAHLQGVAAPNTLVISAATFQLLGGFFACQPLGTPLLKGQTQPLAVYRVLYESMARSRLEAVGSTGLTPLVGREQEIGLLLERWAQVKEGVGQVVLLSGEGGIGKSRLVQVLKDQVVSEPQAWVTLCQGSPYYQHSAWYPMIELLERVVLRFEREESPPQKLSKLEGFLVQYGLPLAEAVPLFAALLSLPLPADYAPVILAPEQQKQQLLQALLMILLRIALQQPVLFVIEDLHWVDPSTLEFLSLLIEQGPTARILTLCTFRPDFRPPWMGRAHLTQVTVNRLPRRQVVEVICQVAHGKALPPEVVAHIVAKTDGVPLFVEELTKMVLESGLLQEREECYELTGPLPPLAIPATLHDSLMARLDRLGPVKGLAQLGATLGREFSFALLRAVSPWDEATVQQGLHQLVEAEFLYQRGLPPQETYLFKHALLQEAAYQSLLKSIRQQHHQRIAQALETQFPETVETQPALLAHHYTEAGRGEQAIRFWQRAGEQALQHLAYTEGIRHFTTAVQLLRTLPATAEHRQQELTILSALGQALGATRGWGDPQVEAIYKRAWELSPQVEETIQGFCVLEGVRLSTLVSGKIPQAHDLGQQLVRLAQRLSNPTALLVAHNHLGDSSYRLGLFPAAQDHFEQGRTLYETQHHWYPPTGEHPGVYAVSYGAVVLWMRGYPDQALGRLCTALELAQTLAHPLSLAWALRFAASLYQQCRDASAVLAQSEALIGLATEQGFAQYVAMGTMLQGWGTSERGQGEQGMQQIRHGLDLWRALGATLGQPYWLALLAEAYGKGGQADTAHRVVEEALALIQQTRESWWEAELYRLKGEGLCVLSSYTHPGVEPCFQYALRVARRQQAKVLELRATMSLARLWQQQGKRDDARELLAPIYGWFTEGFDTVDLQEARALLEELEEGPS